MAWLAQAKAVPQAVNAALPTVSNVHAIHARLEQALAQKGFHLAKSDYADRYANPSDPSSQTLFVYNRGINEDGTLNGKSNYNVCVLCKDSNLRVFMSNPDESDAAAQFDFGKYVQTFTYKAGYSEKFVSKVVASAEKLSALKSESSYRLFAHNHLAELSGEKLNSGDEYMTDDGVSSDHALLMNLILHNADYCALTHHNNFLPSEWAQFDSQARKYGIQLIPGFEATLPLQAHEYWLPEDFGPNPNGPHVVLLLSDADVAAEFWWNHFNRRNEVKYAPIASEGVELSKIYEAIQSKYRGNVATWVAHPVCDIGLPDVGLLNRVAKGEITLDEAFGILSRSNAVAMYNSIIAPEFLDLRAYMDDVDSCEYFSKEEKARRKQNIVVSYRKLKELLKEHGFGPEMTSTNLNLAIAKEAQRRFGTLPVVEADSHNFNWLYTKFGPFFWMVRDMGAFGHGHNTLRLKETPAEKPSPKQVVEFITIRDSFPGAELSPVLFAETRDWNFQATKARSDTWWLQKAFDRLEKLYFYVFKQGFTLLSDMGRVMQKQDQYHAIGRMGRGSIPD